MVSRAGGIACAILRADSHADTRDAHADTDTDAVSRADSRAVLRAWARPGARLEINKTQRQLLHLVEGKIRAELRVLEFI